MLVIRRIHVVYRLRCDDDADREAIERAHAKHHDYCPVYRSLKAAIQITTSYELVAD